MSFIEDIILRDDKRGISALRHALPENYCTEAASYLLANPGRIVIVTGFYILKAQAPETDGPPGAIVIGTALQDLGNEVYYATDQYAEPLLTAVGIPRSRVITFPMLDSQSSKRYSNNLLAQLKPNLLVSIERCGPTEQGQYLNMRGVDISKWTAQLDQLFYEHPNTLGIGDGGNEIGMGNLFNEVRSVPTLVPEPCVVTTSKLVIASVSNWGAYGLVTALSQLKKRDLLPNIDEHGQLIRTMVVHGAVDGFHATRDDRVDGFTLEENLSVLKALKTQI